MCPPLGTLFTCEAMYIPLRPSTLYKSEKGSSVTSLWQIVNNVLLKKIGLNCNLPQPTVFPCAVWEKGQNSSERQLELEYSIFVVDNC